MILKRGGGFNSQARHVGALRHTTGICLTVRFEIQAYSFTAETTNCVEGTSLVTSISRINSVDTVCVIYVNSH